MKTKFINSWRVDLESLNLESILCWALEKKKADRILMAIRMRRIRRRWKVDSPSAETWITQRLGEFVIDRFLAGGWPGSLLTNSPAVVFVCQFSDDVKAIILNEEPKLQNWTHSRKQPLPEDICLFQSEGDLPVFISVTHEKDAWLISETRPRLRGLSRESSGLGSFIFGGKYFCLPREENAKHGEQ